MPYIMVDFVPDYDTSDSYEGGGQERHPQGDES